MAGPVSTRPISGAAISGDAEDPTTLRGRFKRQFRTRVVQDRYPGIDASAVSEPAPPEATKTPIYDALSPDMRAAVDRLVVGIRMANMRGIA